MGCSSSKLDDQEAVQLCKDRKNFIKKAVEHRTEFASGHIAYIQSLKRVSAALKDYVEGDEPREFSIDSFTSPTKKTTPHFITISPTSFTIEPSTNSSVKVNYLRAGGNPSVFVEERPPQTPETARIETFYSPVHQYGMDSFFAMQSPPGNSSSIFHYSPYNSRQNIPPPSPQTSSQWDFFWNPFSSLDYYGYPTRNSDDHQSVFEDDINGLRQVREEEGIPELEEETEQEDIDSRRASRRVEERAKGHVNCAHEDQVTVEDVEEDEDEDEDDDDEFGTDSGAETEHENENEPKTPQRSTQNNQYIEVSKSQNLGQIANQQTAEVVSGQEGGKNEGTPGFTVYVNRRPTSMSEVIKDLEAQFMSICNSANEVSAMLEACKAQYSSTSLELSAMKMLNPVALLRSASSSRSNSSRFLINSSGSSREEGYESNSDLSEESCLFPGSHQSTLDKLYAWEKKLYQEVRAAERVRLAYEKKCAQLKNHDVRGDDHSSVDKTRQAIRDLHTQIKVSIHSVEAVSKRIEALRDQELQPQLLQLVQGLSRMWKTMVECHQTQKRTLDEAKILLAGTPQKQKKYTPMSPSEPHRLARAASNLESELRNWKFCFESWITSQRSYIHAITGWLLRCVRSDPYNTSRFPLSPRQSKRAPPMFGTCIQWARFLDSVSKVPVLDGLDFFAAGVGSLYVHQLKEGGSGRMPLGSSKRYGGGFSVESGMEMVEVGRQEEDGTTDLAAIMTAEKMAEVAIRVLCAGMSVAVSSLTEFALASAQGYTDLIKQWENAKCPESSSGARM